MITRASLAALSPAEAAAAWRVQQDEGLPVEAGLFEDWLTQDEAHRAAWDAVERSWALFDDADDPAFAALRAAALSDRPEPRRGPLTHWRPMAAAAAVLAIVAGGLEFARSPSGTPESRPGVAGGQLYATTTAPATFALADGTRMTLAPEARVRVAFGDARRQVALERGSATYAVRHDAARPFAVSAHDRTIVDVGTRFEVGLAGDATRVALFEGSVRVEGPAGATTLRPGEQLFARPGQRDTITPIAPPGAAQADVVQFDNVTLASAAQTINEGSAIKLVVPDPKVAAMRVSGRFKAHAPERFARTVALLLSLRVVRVDAARIELRRGR